MGDPIDLCACGCEQPVKSVASQNRRGRLKGQPVRFVKGHNTRKAKPGEKWCSRCKRSKLPEEFSPGSRRCKPCAVEHARQYA